MRFISSSLLFLGGAAVALAGTALGQFIVEPSPSATMSTASVQMFPDVQKNTFFAPSVATMVRTGVVKGYDDGSFGPDDPVTRAQVTVMIDRYDKNVVQPMREQIAKMREMLELGRCGDGFVQTGEQCDDGNSSDGDGCSEFCLKEKTSKCLNPGVSFAAPDGCNTCVCGKDGTVTCTLMACPPTQCGDGRCDPGEEFGLCALCIESEITPCPPCRACPKDCAVPVCGNGKCDAGEENLCVTCIESEIMPCPPCLACPKDCAVSNDPAPTCGNGKCDAGEATMCPACIEGATCDGTCFPGTCPKDCVVKVEQAPTPQ